MNPPFAYFRQALFGLFLLWSAAFPGCSAAANLVLWDTWTPITDAGRLNKEEWRVVPTDLFKLEADPLKSSSDPGYYGREYSFKGDLAVENRNYTVIFAGAQGKLLLYAKTAGASVSGDSPLGEKIGELAPLSARGPIRQFSLWRNSGDEIAGEAYFSNREGVVQPLRFVFGKNEIIEFKPHETLGGLSVRAALDFAVVPSFVGDDLIFGAMEGLEADTLTLPAENMLMALLRGGNQQLVLTWPREKETPKLKLADEKEGKRALAAIEVETRGQSLFIAPQSAPGIWHREALSAAYLEKAVASSWKRPFPARWQTQLMEAGVRTRFGFHDGPGTVWRGVPGSYNYPVWFEGETAFYHLSKKVPPKGESIIYFVEGQETPATVLTPADILKATLGRAETEELVDLSGRKLRTHHRRGGAGVRRACTCGCTEAIQAIFEAGEETARKEEIREAIGDMIYFVQAHVQRIDEYRRFAGDIAQYLQARAAAAPELKPCLAEAQQIAEQIPQEYEVQKENMKSLAYADELSARTLQLAEKKETTNLAAYMELLKAWRGMGGSQDYVVAQCHALTRKLFQEASYGCVTQAKALEVALEVRRRCRAILRNADGYEIWPNY